MTAVSASAWTDAIDLVKFNPSAISRVAYDRLQTLTDGTADVVDPTNPFAMLMEACAVHCAANMFQNETNTAKQYPTIAQTIDDLYLHMSDADYIGRFATPARTSMVIMLNKDEVLQRVVATGVGDTKKLTIPRNTQFTVAGLNFTMQYPIDIRVMSHGGLQIVYDTTQISPLQTLTTNQVDWTVTNMRGINFIRLTIPVSQFTITSKIGKLNLSTGFNQTYNFTDQFYYARAFYARADGTWVEMKTTHTDQVFDPTVPTLVLKVLDGQLNVSLPQVYQTTGLVSTEIRVDIYTTVGPLDMNLVDYLPNSFTVKWIDLDGLSSAFVAPLTKFSIMSVFSDAVVTGGANEVDFETLRAQVINNALGSPDYPITNVQTTTRLQQLGYDVVTDVDNITNRTFLATRALPRPSDNSVIAGAGCSIQTLQASMSELVGHSSVMDNGNRITLLPSTLYQSVNGVLSVVTDFQIQSLQQMAVDARARLINQNTYLYSPFHYVYDMNGDTFDLRAYFLDNPYVFTKVFVEENDTTGLEVGTDTYGLARTATGYRLQLTCKSGDAWKALADNQVYCQLSYRPAGEKDRAYLNGTLIGVVNNERVYQFDLTTNYDIDELDNIVLTNFQMYTNPADKHPTALDSDFDVMYIAAGINPTGLMSSQIDLDMGKAILPSNAVGVSRETLKLHLGDVLSGLWTNSRSVASSLDYQRYSADVPAVYSETVYARDPVTGQVVITLDGSGNLQYTILHAKGDPVLDGSGNPTYAHLKGDVMVDAEGNPIVLSSRTMLRQCDLFLLDGVYWFATEAQAAAYKTSLPITVSSWLTDDLAAVSKYLLERTNLYFYPKSTLGQVLANVKEEQQVSINAAQSFSVTYYLSGAAYRDAELRAALTDSAVSTINDALQNSTVSLSDITSKLRAVVGNDAISVDVAGLADGAYTTVTLPDDSVRLSIKKIAVALADGTIGVDDDVGITFLQHTA